MPSGLPEKTLVWCEIRDSVSLLHSTLDSSVLVLEHVLQIFLQGIYSINILCLEKESSGFDLKSKIPGQNLILEPKRYF